MSIPDSLIRHALHCHDHQRAARAGALERDMQSALLLPLPATRHLRPCKHSRAHTDMLARPFAETLSGRILTRLSCSAGLIATFKLAAVFKGRRKQVKQGRSCYVDPKASQI